jgi:beta-lactamase superfamily II metal-dependent hydrolase
MSVWKYDSKTMQFLDIHFLDVGHGDCTVVEFPDRLTVMDINNCKSFGKESEAELRKRYAPKPWLDAATRGLGGFGLIGGSPQGVSLLAQVMEAERKLKEAKDHLTNPIDYFKANFAGRSIFRYIQSHPDMDHMAGLYRIWAEEKIEIVNFWDTKHSIEKDEDAMRSGEVNHDVRDWHAYLKLRKSAESPTVLHLTIGAKGDFYTPDGISVWAPFDHLQENNADCSPNDLSYLLHIQFGQCSVVLGGDTTAETWEKLYDALKSRGDSFRKVNLLKASHHGRKSGYHMESVKSMNPDLTVVSVGELKAKDDATASYERLSNKGCYSTLDHGDIIARCFIDGEIRLFERDWKQIASSW